MGGHKKRKDADMKGFYKYIPKFYNLPQVIMIRWLDYEWIIRK